MIVTVLGGGGFIGRSVAAQLLERGHVVRIASRRPPAIEGIDAHVCDLTDSAQADRVAAAVMGADAVVHLAALLPDRENQHDVRRHVSQNLGLAVGLVPHLVRGLRVVYASTLDVYGPLMSLPADEGAPTVPATYYGAAKLAAEHYLRIACVHVGAPLAVLRLSQVYGPGEPAIKVIPRFIETLVQGREVVVANGGADTRDYVYVEDAARAIVSAVECGFDGTLNIAGGIETSIGEVAELLAEVAGESARVRLLPQSDSRSRSHFNTAGARAALGYVPQVALRDGLAHHYRSTVAAMARNRLGEPL